MCHSPLAQNADFNLFIATSNSSPTSKGTQRGRKNIGLGSPCIHLGFQFLPHTHAQGVKQYLLSVICLSVCCLSVCCLSVCCLSARKFSNILLQADTSSTYNHVISFANSPNAGVPHNTEHVAIICTFRSYYAVQLVVHLEIPYIEL